MVPAHRDAAPSAARSSAEVAQPLAPGPGPSRLARTWLLWLVAGMVVVTIVGGVAWVLLGSSLFESRSVEVAGNKEIPADVVRAVAAVPLGTPMLRLDTAAIERRVAAVPRVASVQVRCSVDGTVRIELTERTPVAVVRRGDGVHLVDATGTDYAAVPVEPPGLPELRSDRVGPRNAATAAALTVLTGLPQWLRGQVRSVAANSPADVVLRLDSAPEGHGRGGNGREVRWGGVEEGDRKAAVLGPLLTQPGKFYDVSSPTLPTIA
ncbi:MAG TPA: FtsQ-type POTRA domain-containing protein [Pseudonocardiaceae bacterium]|jgi:cell division protein FtsQ|nr:FtsQ-type POTRA domain-containing protein [Pseudonocardiaceae bacterium]